MDTLCGSQILFTLSLQCCSALEPFPWSKTSLVSTVFFLWVFTIWLEKDTLPSPCVFWFSIAMKGGDSPTILYRQNPAGSVAAASLSLWGAAHLSVHWTQQQHGGRKKRRQPQGLWSRQRLWFLCTECLQYQPTVLLLLELTGWYNCVWD